MNKDKIISAFIALSLVVGIVAYNHKGGTTVITDSTGQTHVVGAVSSPEISDNHISVNGVTYWTLRQNMTTATSTICSFPNPAGAATTTKGNTGTTIPAVGMATSTFLSMSVQVTTGTSTATTFDISTSTSPWGATTTPEFMYGSSIAANSMFSGSWAFGDIATSTDKSLNASMPSVPGDKARVGPGEFVNVTTSSTGQSGTGFTYGGQCIARFMSQNAF